MKSNDFLNCGVAINRHDIQEMEKKLDIRLPESMIDHYLTFNGGMPTYDYFPASNDWEPIWVHEFMSIGKKDDEELSIQNTYARVVGVAGFPSCFVPFAVDAGGNFFCVNSTDGSIHYWVNDVYDRNLTDEQNKNNSDRFLTVSFEAFMKSLVSEDEAYK